MNYKKRIAVVCNYKLNPNRIGGMDRFYLAYDTRAKELGFEVHWYFTEFNKPFDFFSKLTIFTSENKPIEEFFLKKIDKNELF